MPWVALLGLSSTNVTATTNALLPCSAQAYLSICSIMRSCAMQCICNSMGFLMMGGPYLMARLAEGHRHYVPTMRKEETSWWPGSMKVTAGMRHTWQCIGTSSANVAAWLVWLAWLNY